MHTALLGVPPLHVGNAGCQGGRGQHDHACQRRQLLLVCQLHQVSATQSLKQSLERMQTIVKEAEASMTMPASGGNCCLSASSTKYLQHDNK